jgi:hypothetical protein
MRTVLMIANQIQAALSAVATRVDEIWNYLQAQGSAAGAHLADIDARLTAIEQAVSEPGTSPDQAAVDALTAQVAAATAGLNQSTAGLEAAITTEEKQTT